MLEAFALHLSWNVFFTCSILSFFILGKYSSISKYISEKKISLKNYQEFILIKQISHPYKLQTHYLNMKLKF